MGERATAVVATQPVRADGRQFPDVHSLRLRVSILAAVHRRAWRGRHSASRGLVRYQQLWPGPRPVGVFTHMGRCGGSARSTLDGAASGIWRRTGDRLDGPEPEHLGIHGPAAGPGCDDWCRGGGYGPGHVVRTPRAHRPGAGHHPDVVVRRQRGWTVSWRLCRRSRRVPPQLRHQRRVVPAGRRGHGPVRDRELRPAAG